jgi:hypothetical protein
MRRTISCPSLVVVIRASAIASILFALPAFAEDAPAAAPAPSTEIATVPEPTEAAPPAIVTDTGAPAVEEAPAPRYPRSVIARPLTLPSGVAMIGADATANHDFSAMGGSPIVGYGFTDDFEVLVPYSFAAKEFEAKGSVALDAGYKLLRGAVGGKLEAIARVRGGYNALDEVATPLMLGVHVQYNFTPTLAIISGYAGTQQIRISLAEDAEMAKPIDIGLPIALGYQPTSELYVQLDTKLATVNLSESANTLIGKDTTPAALTVVYNVINALDIQAAVGTDLSNSPGDALSFLVGARYYAGQL